MARERFSAKEIDAAKRWDFECPRPKHLSGQPLNSGADDRSEPTFRTDHFAAPVTMLNQDSRHQLSH
jgi:hypothetical protein